MLKQECKKDFTLKLCLYEIKGDKAQKMPIQYHFHLFTLWEFVETKKNPEVINSFDFIDYPIENAFWDKPGNLKWFDLSTIQTLLRNASSIVNQTEGSEVLAFALN